MLACVPDAICGDLRSSGPAGAAKELCSLEVELDQGRHYSLLQLLLLL